MDRKIKTGQQIGFSEVLFSDFLLIKPIIPQTPCNKLLFARR